MGNSIFEIKLIAGFKTAAVMLISFYITTQVAGLF